MSDANMERLEAVIPDRRDAVVVDELMTEIEDCLGCGNICAIGLYDRLKVIRRAVVGMVGQRDSQRNLPSWEEGF